MSQKHVGLDGSEIFNLNTIDYRDISPMIFGKIQILIHFEAQRAVMFVAKLRNNDKIAPSGVACQMRNIDVIFANVPHTAILLVLLQFVIVRTYLF